MAERTMTDEHKAAIAAGRTEAAAVRDYLGAPESQRPKRGRQVNAETLAERRAGIDSQLAAIADEPDMTAAETRFIAHAANYS